jgi:hypothetical protein
MTIANMEVNPSENVFVFQKSRRYVEKRRAVNAGGIAIKSTVDSPPNSPSIRVIPSAPNEAPIKSAKYSFPVISLKISNAWASVMPARKNGTADVIKYRLR